MIAKHATRTLLLVESHAVTREALAQVFRSEGYQVLTAGTSDEALDHLRGPEPPTVVLFDLRDVSDEGDRFLEARARDSAIASVPVVIMSEGQADPKWLAAPGVAGAFRKPVAIEPLLTLVRGVE